MPSKAPANYFDRFDTPPLPAGYEPEGPWQDYQQQQPAGSQRINFDDLIPKKGAQQSPGMFDDILSSPAAPTAKGGLSFDDLIPTQGGSQGNYFDRFDTPATFDERFNAGNPPQDSVGGSLKALGVGAGEGAIGLAGLPGDLTNLGSKLLDYLAGTHSNEAVGPYASAIGSDSIQKGVESITGPFRHGQTPLEQGLETVGQFAPALLGGGEGLATKVLTRMVAPGLASEAAGEATRGTAAEPFARAGAAILGGGLAGGLSGARSAASPTEGALDAARTAQYNSPAVKDLRLTPEGIAAQVDKNFSDLLNNKIDPINAPHVTAILNNLSGPARFEAPTTQTKTILSGPGFHIADDTQKAAPYQVQDLDLARQSLSNVPYEEKRAASIVRKNIDNYLGNIPDSDVASGDAAAANKALLDARGNTAALKRSQDITNALGRAENQAGSTYSGNNLDNATRQQLRPILNQKQGVAKSQAFQDYTDDEIAALKDAVNGSMLGNAVRSAGKTLGGGGGIGHLGAGLTGGLAAHEAGADPYTSIALGLGASLAGRGLNAYANRLTASSANAVTDLLRQRSPLAAAQAQPGGMFRLSPALAIQALANSHPLRITIPSLPGPQ